MNHSDHVRLIRDGIHALDGVWADFGSGRGVFTLALAEQLQSQAQIYSIDLDADSLRAQQAALQDCYPAITAHYLTADFTQQIELPPLDGIVMANALHFLRNKGPVLHLIRQYLKPEGRLILVEYNTDTGNRWVPFPITFSTWERLAAQHGFKHTWLLHTHPSSFMGQFFSACSEKGTPD
jgi:ubiquinone/menaquinone biosynthesis C-methylase UbiE